MNGKLEKAQAERAARLREQIDRLEREDASGKPKIPSPESEPPSDTPKLSPRDFIHKRMRELDQK